MYVCILFYRGSKLKWGYSRRRKNNLIGNILWYIFCFQVLNTENMIITQSVMFCIDDICGNNYSSHTSALYYLQVVVP